MTTSNFPEYVAGVDYGPCFGGCSPTAPCRSRQSTLHWWQKDRNKEALARQASKSAESAEIELRADGPHVVMTKLSPELKAELRKAAARLGLSDSSYLRLLIVQATWDRSATPESVSPELMQPASEFCVDVFLTLRDGVNTPIVNHALCLKEDDSVTMEVPPNAKYLSLRVDK